MIVDGVGLRKTYEPEGGEPRAGDLQPLIQTSGGAERGRIVVVGGELHRWGFVGRVRRGGVDGSTPRCPPSSSSARSRVAGWAKSGTGLAADPRQS